MHEKTKEKAPNRVDFYDCAILANEQILKGHIIYQKFWCANCGEVQHIDRANAFYTQGKCEECDHISDLINDGCNYVLVTLFT